MIKKYLSLIFNIHFHEWEYSDIYDPAYKDLKNNLRKCVCGKVQQYDIDGWCNYKSSENDPCLRILLALHEGWARR